MITFTNISEADEALRRATIQNWGSLDEDTQNKLFNLTSLGTSPVDRIVKSSELIYARRETMPQSLKEAAAGAFRFSTFMGFHGLQENDRGNKAADVLDGAEVENPPEPLDEYVITEVLKQPAP